MRKLPDYSAKYCNPTDCSTYSFFDGLRWSRGDVNVRLKGPAAYTTMQKRAAKVGLHQPVRLVLDELHSAVTSTQLLSGHGDDDEPKDTAMNPNLPRVVRHRRTWPTQSPPKSKKLSGGPPRERHVLRSADVQQPASGTMELDSGFRERSGIYNETRGSVEIGRVRESEGEDDPGRGLDGESDVGSNIIVSRVREDEGEEDPRLGFDGESDVGSNIIVSRHRLRSSDERRQVRFTDNALYTRARDRTYSPSPSLGTEDESEMEN